MPVDSRIPAASKSRDSKSVAAGAAAETAVDGAVGERLSTSKKRFLTAAARGAAEGAVQGGAAAAGTGAAKEAGLEAVRHSREREGPAVEPSISDRAGDDQSHPSAPPPGEARSGEDLGAGGTSYERDQLAADALAGGARPGAGGPPTASRTKGAALAGAASATPPAALLALLTLFLNWLKSFFFAMLAQALSFLQLMLQWMISAGTAVWNVATKPFLAAGATVAKVVAALSGGAAISTTVAAAGVAAVSGVSVLALIGGLLGILSTTLTVHDGTPAADCNQSGSSTLPVGDSGRVDANADKNARAVYSVLKTWGMPDENIAGILGNWTQESGIDPTSVQNFPTGTYVMTDKKKSAAQNTSNGIGLGQWTFGRNTLLRNYATAKGADWWDLGLQLRFMADPNGGDNPGDVQVFKGMLVTSQGSPARAAVYFHENWERSADGSAGIVARSAKAEMWFAKMSGWTVDKGLVRQIVGDFLDGGSQIIDLLKPATCASGNNTGAVSPKSGGMSQDEAQALVDLFNQEGDKFLDSRYGDQGGPGSCGSNHAMNCTSFSTYFVNKYTSFQAYPAGDGIRTAYTIAEQTGKKMQSTPVPYSVGSGPASTSWGHTLVVLGVEGDKVILGEAGYCAYMGRVRVDSAAAMAAEGWMFVDVSDLMLPADQVKKS
ncbi:phage tail tip lysozyme [Kribbella sp. DT2]|uniref:phage tail tip lysozyme n=1 Tax=Kribbella sp. DT2 TaxID=3393427 RepID=UPI003CF7AA9C